MKHNQADVVIIGGGIIGCSIAYQLAKQRNSVIVIETASRVGTEASWAGAGILTSHASTHEPYPELCRASLALYPALAAELKAETEIDIEFIRSGTLSVFFNETEAAGLIGLAGRRVSRGFFCGGTIPRTNAAIRTGCLKNYCWCCAVSGGWTCT